MTTKRRKLPDAAPYTGWIEPTATGETVTWGSWEPRRTERCTFPITLFPYASGSDYSGTLVERSNYRVLSDDEDVMASSVLVVGGHGTFGIAYIGTPSDHIREICEQLDNYPLLDESDHSDLETETEQEQWADRGRSEFRGDVVEAFGLEDDVRLTDELLDRTWWSFANQHGDGGRVFEQGDSCHFYINDAIKWLRETRCRGGHIVLGRVEYGERDHLSVLLDALEEGKVSVAEEMLKGWEDVALLNMGVES